MTSVSATLERCAEAILARSSWVAARLLRAGPTPCLDWFVSALST